MLFAPCLTTPHRTTDFLDALTADVTGLREIANRRFRTLTDDQLNRGPGPGKWSVGQCLEHLNIVGGLYLPVMSRKLKAAQQRGSSPSEVVKHGYFGQKMTDAMRVPASEKPLQTPQQYAPSGSRLPRTVVEVFSRQLDELSSLLEQARRVNMNAIRIPNPIIPLHAAPPHRRAGAAGGAHQASHQPGRARAGRPRCDEW